MGLSGSGNLFDKDLSFDKAIIEASKLYRVTGTSLWILINP